MNFERIKAIKSQKNYHILNVKAGQLIEIYEKMGEGNNARVWKFKGLVLKVQRSGSHNGTFTIRGKSSGITLEKVYPLSFQNFEKLILLDEFKVRQSNIYYMRDKIGKDAKMQSIISKERKGIDLLLEAKNEVQLNSNEIKKDNISVNEIQEQQTENDVEDNTEVK